MRKKKTIIKKKKKKKRKRRIPIFSPNVNCLFFAFIFPIYNLPIFIPLFIVFIA